MLKIRTSDLPRPRWPSHPGRLSDGDYAALRSGGGHTEASRITSYNKNNMAGELVPYRSGKNQGNRWSFPFADQRLRDRSGPVRPTGADFTTGDVGTRRCCIGPDFVAGRVCPESASTQPVESLRTVVRTRFARNLAVAQSEEVRASDEMIIDRTVLHDFVGIVTRTTVRSA